MTQYNTTQYKQNVDSLDQLSSVTLLGLAVVGAILTVGAYWLLGI